MRFIGTKESIIRDKQGQTYDTGVTTAHEWGHIMGAQHVALDDTVMHDSSHTQGDFIPKTNWDQVTR